MVHPQTENRRISAFTYRGGPLVSYCHGIHLVFGFLREPVFQGTSFQPVLSDPAAVSPESVERLIFVSGRHYYTLSKHIQASLPTFISLKNASNLLVRLLRLVSFQLEIHVQYVLVGLIKDVFICSNEEKNARISAIRFGQKN
jgi:hypothetical protein